MSASKLKAADPLYELSLLPLPPKGFDVPSIGSRVIFDADGR